MSIRTWVYIIRSGEDCDVCMMAGVILAMEDEYTHIGWSTGCQYPPHVTRRTFLQKSSRRECEFYTHSVHIFANEQNPIVGGGGSCRGGTSSPTGSQTLQLTHHVTHASRALPSCGSVFIYFSCSRNFTVVLKHNPDMIIGRIWKVVVDLHKPRPWVRSVSTISLCLEKHFYR